MTTYCQRRPVERTGFFSGKFNSFLFVERYNQWTLVLTSIQKKELPTQEVRPHAPWAELTCPLYTLSPKICLQSQPQSPMSSRIIFTRFVTELFRPFPKVKSTLPEDEAKECGTGFRKDSERFQKCLGPGPHQRIQWSLMRYRSFFASSTSQMETFIFTMRSNLFVCLIAWPSPLATLWHVSVVSWDNYEWVVSTFGFHSEFLAAPNPKPGTQFMFHQYLLHKICYTELMREAILVLFLLRCEG